MKKLLCVLGLLGVLCACDKHEDKTQQSPLVKGVITFRAFHQDICKCVLDNMPTFVKTLNSDGYNNIDAFCFWSAYLCSNQKSDETIIAAAKIINDLGNFQCTDPKFNEKFVAASQKAGVDALCTVMWQQDVVLYLSKLAHLTNSCSSTFGKSINECLCIVDKYMKSLSESELKALSNYGQFFPGYGWMANTKAKQQMTVNIMTKMRNAVAACAE